MSDDPREYGVKLETKLEKSVGSIDQPSTRTVEGNGTALRKEGNRVIDGSSDRRLVGPPSTELGTDKYAPDYYKADNSGRATTNPPFSKASGLREMPQKFTAGSGNPPSRLND